MVKIWGVTLGCELQVQVYMYKKLVCFVVTSSTKFTIFQLSLNQQYEQTGSWRDAWRGCSWMFRSMLGSQLFVLPQYVQAVPSTHATVVCDTDEKRHEIMELPNYRFHILISCSIFNSIISGCRGNKIEN